jgi:hypothetical protein
VVLAAKRQRPDGALDDVGVDLDAAVVVEELGQAVPAPESLADRLGELALPAVQTSSTRR